MGRGNRVSRFFQAPARRPKGGRAAKDAYVPPAPAPAAGAAPPSPADAFASRKVAPPRPLVWVGTAASGAAVWSSPVANGAGQRIWSELHDVAHHAGAWPVLTGSAPLPESWHLSQGHDPDEVVTPDVEPLLTTALELLPTPELGFRTRLEPSPEATVETDLAAGYLALVTGVEGWQVPVAIGFGGVGGWSATEHSAVLRRWSQQYQADLVALTDTALGLRVRRPPVRHDEAMAAAEQIYAYCPDVVEHGVGSMWALATTIAVSPAWSLRWST